MNPDEIRREILFQLYGLRLALTPTLMHRECRKQRMDCTLTQIKHECRFLLSDGCVSEVIVPGQSEAAYEITAKGVRSQES